MKTRLHFREIASFEIEQFVRSRMAEPSYRDAGECQKRSFHIHCSSPLNASHCFAVNSELQKVSWRKFAPGVTRAAQGATPDRDKKADGPCRAIEIVVAMRLTTS